MRRLAVLLVTAMVIPLVVGSPAVALTAPPGFDTSAFAGGFTYPTSARFLPDGRMLVADKQGELWLIVDGVTRATPVIDLRDQVDDYWDRGMVGLAVDPNFASNGYIYLYYALENGTGDGGPTTGRLSRFTMVGETANPDTEFIVLGHQDQNTVRCSELPVDSDCIPEDFYGHEGGGLEFASDGTLWFSVGDSGSWDLVNDQSLRAQDLTTFAGKLLHITALGKGVSTNPFWTGNEDDIRSRIYAYGFRNPFRITVHPATGIPYVGDVGWSGWEEINKVVAGGDYGWPCYEGTGQQAGYAQSATCQTLYSQGTNAVKAPLYAYPHQGGASVTGGIFLAGSAFPAAYQNSYLFGDYAANYIHYLDLDANGDIPAGGGEQGFATGADGPVDFTIGPDGAVYYVAILAGEVRRISYEFSGGQTYVSDLQFTSASNGSGPFERDSSNGGTGAGDGGPITLEGVQYAKGIGVSAPSQIEFAVPAGCTTFSAVVGIDDEVGISGSANFVVGNGANPLWQSGLLTGSTASQQVQVPLSGISSLRLTVDDGGDGSSLDHADWADATLACGTDTTSPTVVSFSPPNGVTGVGTASAQVARFSEPLDATTVTSSTVQLATQPGGVAVTGTVTYDNTSRSITFTPTSALTPNTGYRLQLLGGPTGIADLAGNRLATVNTTFTTGSDSTTTSYVSDMTWGTVTNGYGPPERDRSNGEQGATDGVPIRVANIAYPKGVGAHANSTIPLDLTGLNCTRFQSVIGVDDEVANNGSVRFQVWNGTTTMLTQSAVITGASATATIDLNITGITNLRLVITDNGDSDAYDHADWADAKLTCGQTNAPTVVIDTPGTNATYSVGDTVSFTGHATASNGSPIAPLQLQWEVQIRHCPQGDCHLHPVTQVTGTGGSIMFPDHGDDSHIDIKLTATDGAGQSAFAGSLHRANAGRAHTQHEPTRATAGVHGRCGHDSGDGAGGEWRHPHDRRARRCGVCLPILV